MKNKTIILTPYHFRVTSKGICFSGVRGESKNFDKQRYEIHIMFGENYWFSQLAIKLKDTLRHKLSIIQNQINSI